MPLLSGHIINFSLFNFQNTKQNWNALERVPSTMYHLAVPCKVCSHPQRIAIDRQIVNGRPLRALVASFGISLGALHRHKNTHLKEALAEAMRSRASENEEHGTDLLQRVRKLASEAEEILATAKTAGNLKAATSAICACVRVLELTGRLDGSLAQPNTPGLHLHLNKTTINVGSYDDDNELSLLIGEATRNFDPVEIQRLKILAERQSQPPKALLACSNLAPSR
jgi:hypothetical protein